MTNKPTTLSLYIHVAQSSGLRRDAVSSYTAPVSMTLGTELGRLLEINRCLLRLCVAAAQNKDSKSKERYLKH